MHVSIANIQQLLNQCVDDVKKLEILSHQIKHTNVVPDYDKEKFYLIDLTVRNLTNNSDARKMTINNVLLPKNVIRGNSVQIDTKTNMLKYIRKYDNVIVTDSLISILTDFQIEEIYKNIKIKNDEYYCVCDKSILFEFLRSIDSKEQYFKHFNVYDIDKIKLSTCLQNRTEYKFIGSYTYHNLITNNLTQAQQINKIMKFTIMLEQ